MIIFAVVLGVLLLLLILLLCLPLHAGLEYANTDGKQTLLLRFRLFGIPLRITVPLGKKKQDTRKKEKKKPKKELPAKQKKKMTPSRFFSSVRGIKSAYKASKEDIRSVLAAIRKRLEFDTVTFHIHFGTDNAAKTGITTGVVWTSASCLVSVLNQMFGVRKIDLNVTPDFQQECFRIHVKSIVCFRPVHIISIAMKVVKIVNLFIEKMDET